MKKELTKNLMLDRLNTICHKCMMLQRQMINDNHHSSCDWLRCDQHCPFYNELKNRIRGSENEDQ